MITHVFFDFFGTLVDYSPSRTEQGHRGSHRTLTEAGCRLNYDEFLQHWDDFAARFDARADDSLIEYSMEQVCSAFLTQIFDALPADDLLDRFIARYLDEWNRGVVYRPGLPAMLSRLSQRYTLAVITNTHSTTLVPEHLAQMGVASHFEAVVTSLEHGRRKPHPDIFHSALQQLDAPATRSVYVGDSYRADYQGSTAAGMIGYLIDPDASAPVPRHARIASIGDLESQLLAI